MTTNLGVERERSLSLSKNIISGFYFLVLLLSDRANVAGDCKRGGNGKTLGDSYLASKRDFSSGRDHSHSSCGNGTVVQQWFQASCKSKTGPPFPREKMIIS